MKDQVKDEYFDEAAETIVEEEDLKFHQKVWRGIKKNPGAIGFGIVCALLGIGATNAHYKKESKHQDKVADLAIEEAYARGKIDGTIETYDKIIMTKDI